LLLQVWFIYLFNSLETGHHLVLAKYPDRYNKLMAINGLEFESTFPTGTSVGLCKMDRIPGGRGRGGFQY